jgi:hypothetical protein
MCSPGVVDSTARPCNDIGSYYRPQEKMLFLVDTDDKAQRDDQLAEGLGEVACLYNEITPCFAAELQAAIATKP